MTAKALFTVAGDPLPMSVAPISPEDQTVRRARDPNLPVDYLVAVDLSETAPNQSERIFGQLAI